MEFNAWSIFVDLGFVSILFLIGVILRSKVKFIQKLFLPAGIIAGLLGLLLGPNGVGFIPFSSQIGSYPGILIAVIFGALPLISPAVNWKVISKRVGSMWSYSQIVMICMWGGGLLFSLLVLNNIWGDLHSGFGLLLAAGFSGGHGTAAAIGAAFQSHGWENATSLAMTSATVGIISSIIGGLIFIKLATMKGETNHLTSFKDLSPELRNGLIPTSSRKPSYIDTVSPISIDPLVFHLALVSIIALAGYYLSQFIGGLFPSVAIPTFSLAFLIGLVLKLILTKTKTDQYVSKDMLNRISGGATDFLVAFGISSISLPVVIDYFLPLSILFIFGLLYAFFSCRLLAKHFFKDTWFEKGLFTWGWATGTMAMGIALLRIADPDTESTTLEDFGLAYIPMAPVEIAVVTFAPFMIVSGQSWLFILLTLGGAVVLYLFARANKWVKTTLVEKKSNISA
ncbi:sodium/glutamate symporter [Metabacillus sp. B2-18]|uniref:sodium/glutamate symporter n=1 Tax=Metabacillus sp. B2-18 TaxID=2897333 RepID=UPI001E48CF37|nr:sodium/glutamate symporter [Metabacillus sp. B2-18]UGB33232.1 sodium:glutamate symporter [Metabacillus sp. B2-18]